MPDCWAPSARSKKLYMRYMHQIACPVQTSDLPIEPLREIRGWGSWMADYRSRSNLQSATT